jgi:heptaprenyl diphosphate synthase
MKGERAGAPQPVSRRGSGGSEPTGEPAVSGCLSFTLTATDQDHRIAKLAALAIGLSVVEAAVPSPIPGVKPGIANIVVLLVLHRYGLRAAAWVSLLRVVGGSLVFGSFLTPTFVLSFSGAVHALAALTLASHLPARYFGAVSQSVLASFAHIGGQLLIVYFWLIPHAGIVYLVPLLAAAALVFGTVNGIIAARLLASDPRPAGARLAPQN